MKLDKRHRFLVCLPSLLRDGPGPSRASHDDPFDAIRAAERIAKVRRLDPQQWAGRQMSGWEMLDADGTVRAYIVDTMADVPVGPIGAPRLPGVTR